MQNKSTSLFLFMRMFRIITVTLGFCYNRHLLLLKTFLKEFYSWLVCLFSKSYM